VGKDHHERVRIYGASLAAHAQRLLRNAQPALARLRVHQQMARLPEAQPHPEFRETTGRDYKVPESLLRQLVREIVPEAAPVSLLALGDLLLIGFPGEPISSLGLQARELGREAGFRYVTHPSRLSTTGLATSSPATSTSRAATRRRSHSTDLMQARRLWAPCGQG
jgi:hypothetical protein